MQPLWHTFDIANKMFTLFFHSVFIIYLFIYSKNLKLFKMENVNQTIGEVAAQISNSEKIAQLRMRLKDLSIKSNDLIINDGPLDEIEKLETERSNVNTEIKKLNGVIERENKIKEYNEKLDTHLSIIDVFEKEVVAYHDFLKTVPSFENRTPEQTDEYNKMYESLNHSREILVNELKKSFSNKITINAGPGVTGKKVAAELNGDSGDDQKNGDSKAAQILKLIGEGLSNDDIVAMGYKDGTVRYQRWIFNKEAKKEVASNDTK